MIIGISGAARSGKDSFYLLFKKILNEDFQIERSAFADELKKDIRPLLIEKFNIDVNSYSDEEKEIVRPLMVSYGTLARSIDENFWIKKISNKVEKEQESNIISVITDVRYSNEQEWIKENFKNSINIFVQRLGNSPANEDERNNLPILKQNADHIVVWDNFDDQNINHGESQVKSFIHARL
tara:strand:- start:1868 stop:2413 length:546 start_codon:yes stop_codon:yes gene_type:complete